MANRNTKRLRASKNPELRRGFKVHTGRAVNSTVERRDSGRRPYDAPTMKAHPVSGAAPMRLLAR